LLQTLLARVTAPQRDSSGPFLFSIDHCFQIKGQGSVMTGTVLQGAVGVGDTIDIPALKVFLNARERLRGAVAVV
jgi:selenocysteine-specific elongation factor